MGTRNLTVVMHKGRRRVAQYGQWDGYPSGNGATILEFCQDLVNKKAVPMFRKAVDRTTFVSDDRVDELYKGFFKKEVGNFISYDDSKRFGKAYPALSRDTGAGILAYIMFSKDKVIEVVDSVEFANDGLFCEWMYVVDLDKRALEVYKGIYGGGGRPSENYPSMELLKTYKFSKLPTVKDFCDELNKLRGE